LIEGKGERQKGRKVPELKRSGQRGKPGWGEKEPRAVFPHEPGRKGGGGKRIHNYVGSIRKKKRENKIQGKKKGEKGRNDGGGKGKTLSVK